MSPGGQEDQVTAQSKCGRSNYHNNRPTLQGHQLNPREALVNTPMFAKMRKTSNLKNKTTKTLRVVAQCTSIVTIH